MKRTILSFMLPCLLFGWSSPSVAQKLFHSLDEVYRDSNYVKARQRAEQPHTSRLIGKHCGEKVTTHP